MPTYEYECQACGYRFEKFQRISDKPLKMCPQCGGQIHRLLSAGGGFIFKGSGFYETDYKHAKSAASTRCGNDQTCCGRSEPCASPPCKKD